MATEAPDLLTRVLDAMPVAVLVAAPDGRILRANEAARRLLGYRASEIEGGLRLADVHHRPDEVRLQRERLQTRPAEVSPSADPLDVTLRARNGDLIATRATVAQLRDNAGNPVGTSHAFEDRREVTSLALRLADAAGQVETLEQRVSGQTALGRAAHELSQPLTAALGHIDMLLLEGGVSEAASERLERAIEQLERMRNLVHEFARSANAGRAPR